jgi:hypothetical protein
VLVAVALVCTICWLLVALDAAGVLALAGLLPLELHALYAVASVCGWIAGLAYVSLVGRAEPSPTAKRRLLLLLVLGPPSLPTLLRAMAPVSWQLAAPLVPLWSLGVETIFFCVPVSFGTRGRSRSR